MVPAVRGILAVLLRHHNKLLATMCWLCTVAALILYQLNAFWLNESNKNNSGKEKTLAERVYFQAFWDTPARRRLSQWLPKWHDVDNSCCLFLLWRVGLLTPRVTSLLRPHTNTLLTSITRVFTHTWTPTPGNSSCSLALRCVCLSICSCLIPSKEASSVEKCEVDQFKLTDGAAVTALLSFEASLKCLLFFSLFIPVFITCLCEREFVGYVKPLGGQHFALCGRILETRWLFWLLLRR